MAKSESNLAGEAAVDRRQTVAESAAAADTRLRGIEAKLERLEARIAEADSRLTQRCHDLDAKIPAAG